MAYVGNDLSPLCQTIEGVFGENFYANSGADSLATILGAGYFSDGTKRGLALGDIIYALVSGVTYQLNVLSISGTACTVQLQPTGFNATFSQSTIILPLQLADIVAGTFQVAVPFAFKVNSVGFRTAKAATTAAKLATLTAAIGGVSVTGGVISLTSANQNTIGALLAGTAITALNTGAAGAALGVTASAVTAFIEGDGWVEFNVTNTDMAH